ncbi:MAG: choice-of-anchor D domain-containing protein [Terriglobales bacterium]
MRKSAFTISTVGVFLVAFLAVAQAQNTITTLAGGGPNNLPALFSSIGAPWALVQDGNGNTYISDNLSNRIFKVTANGTLTVLAGNIFSNYSGDGQQATLASLNSPEGIAVDSSGNVYFADTPNNAIRVINTQSSSIPFYGGLLVVPAGAIQTVVGGTLGYATGGGPVSVANAGLNAPGGVWLDPSGNIYIADTGNSVIEVVNTQSTTQTLGGVSVPSYYIAKIAGTNISTFGGDGGPANSASVSRPGGIFLDGNGYIYIADTVNSRIRVINPATSGPPIVVAGVSIPAGDINTVAGSATACGTSTDPCGDNGLATSANLNNPVAVVTDSSGDIYIADTGDERIRLVSNATFKISTIAGSGTQCFYNLTPCGDGGSALIADLWEPTGLVLQGADVLIADQSDDAIRTVASGDINTTMGVLLDASYSGDASPGPPVIQGTATDAELRSPQGVVSDSSGNVYITDTGNEAIRKVTPGGVITTAVGCLVNPCGDRVLANSARLFGPTQTALDATGNLYIVEAGPNGNDIRVVNNQSRPITFYTGPAQQTVPAGDILTIVGTTACTVLPCGDGGPAILAQLNQPDGLFVDKSGNIYIADTSDNAIRVVNMQSGAIVVAGVSIPAGDIMTVAGTLDINPAGDCTPSTALCGDGGPATSALLSLPTGVALDSAGNIYIADAGDNRIRAVNTQSSAVMVEGVSIPAGDIATIAGTGVACTTNCGDGGPAIHANLDVPEGVFLDYAGNVFIADTQDFSVREVTGGIINAVVDAAQNIGFLGDGGPATAAELANPSGLGGDPFGNLLIADTRNWRIRAVTGLVFTPPLASLSPSSVTFPAQALNTKSADIPVTLSNTGNGTALTATVTISGANKADFAQTNNCASVAGPGSCTISVTVTPSASGARSAVLTVTDNAAGSPQSIDLSGTGEDFTLAKTGTLSNPTVTAGSSATATITIAPGNGLAATVDLTCTVTPATAVPPTCSLSPASLTPGTTKSTLTVKTLAATSGALLAPGMVRRSAPLYAIWLLLPGMLLSTAGMGASRRRRLLSYFLIFCAIAGCLFLVACGGGSSSSGGGGGGGGTGGGTAGTTAGSYTVTVTAKTSTTTANQTFPLTVQ